MNDINYFLNLSLQRYGHKTCVLIENLIQQNESDNTEYKIIHLDEILRNNKSINTIYKNDFFRTIPALLDKNYTVVIVDYIDKQLKKMDIVAVHQPVQKQLNLPPIFI